MVEIRIHGRGGQGGVTLAKLIATSRFLRGQSVQAFGLYAAERTGAPVQAFCRWDDRPITDRNLIYEPDHVIVLDPTLVGPEIVRGLAGGGWILVNIDRDPGELAEPYASWRVATVDATTIARAHGLGTRTVPIVNTALAGAVARMLDMSVEEMLAAFEHLGFRGADAHAAEQAYGALRIGPPARAAAATNGHVRPGLVERSPSFLEGAGGARPTNRAGRWATEHPKRRQWIPPCNHVCPAGNDVQGFLWALAEGRTHDALEVLLRTTPLPAVCGRVCPAPCMDSCNRRDLDGAVDVRALERFAADRGVASLEPAERRGERVAVVGSGPAGLSAAYHLGLLGYGVTLYEAGAELGGLLRTGIPEFRLPRDVLDREIARILELGVEAVTEHHVDRDGLARLAGAYDAVLVGTGLQNARDLRLDAEGNGLVVQGIDFLDRVRRGVEPALHGAAVVVVGGGNTAFDAARSAVRLGADSVRIVYRRSRREMPAIREEIEEALEEGVHLDVLSQPLLIQRTAQADGDSGQPHLLCRRTRLGEPDASGRRSPVEVPGTEYSVPCHKVVLALGQSADLSLFPPGVEVREGARLLEPDGTPVYAIGDVASGEGTAAAAIGAGRRAALRVHEDLSGDVLEPPSRIRADIEQSIDEVIGSDVLKLELIEPRPSLPGPTLDRTRRRRTFDEVHLCANSALEAKRCLSCGVCNECDICVTYCPEGVLTREGHRLLVDYEQCKGCGICAAECPRGVVFMSHL